MAALRGSSSAGQGGGVRDHGGGTRARNPIPRALGRSSCKPPPRASSRSPGKSRRPVAMRRKGGWVPCPAQRAAVLIAARAGCPVSTIYGVISLLPLPLVARSWSTAAATLA